MASFKTALFNWKGRSVETDQASINNLNKNYIKDSMVWWYETKYYLPQTKLFWGKT